jgi:cephalosporin-C deacetylase
MPIDELRAYAPEIAEPADFDDFWRDTLAETERHALDASFASVDDPLFNAVDVYDASFAGYAGQVIRGWFIEPTGNTQSLPCIINFIGYGGGRSLPVDHVAPAAAGFAYFVMDTRGQGSVWSPGDTPDDAGGGPHHPGFVTKGIGSPHDYYYRRVFADATRAVAAAAGHPHVDAARIAVSGASQGGGIAIAAAGLCGKRVKLLMADVPFLCHFRRATELTIDTGYSEIRRYLACHRDLVEQTFATLAYFDGVNLAKRVNARTLFSVGLMDAVCPPSTIFAAYNRIGSAKEIRIYDFNEHEGGGPFQATQRLRFARRHL